MLKVAVITVSDRVAKGEYADLSGPRIKEILLQRLPGIDIVQAVVADEKEAILSVLEQNLDKDYILTTGGTGLSPKDITPEICAQLCDRDLPGISEWLRHESLRETPYAVFSRAYSGQKGKTIIVNFPGSLHAAEMCATLIAGVMVHGRNMAHGGRHEMPSS
jgi:molybdopterin adenylyltransferase